MSNIDAFLKLVKEQEIIAVDVHVPSVNRIVKFKPITVQQQKNIIKDTLSGVKGNLQIQKTMNDIICDNILEDIDINVVERSVILSQLRVAYLGVRVMVDGKRETIKLAPQDPIDKELLIKQISCNGITAFVESPTLKRDSSYITMLTAGREFDNPADLINEMYSYEVAKYIRKFEYGGQSYDLTASDGVAVVNSLPTKLVVDVMKFIKNGKDFDNTALITTEGNQVILNSSFFNDPV